MEVTVEKIGAQGDGLADTPEGRLYIPFAAPGDRLRVEPGAERGDGRVAQIAEVIAPGPGRIDPACRHFGDCGGCRFQHLAPDAIAAIKRDLLETALARRRLPGLLVDHTVSVPPGTRRRVRLSFRRAMRAVVGYNRRESHMVLNVLECPVVLPEIAALLAPLRTLCNALPALGKGADILVTRYDAGIDLLLVPDKPAEPGLEDREALAAFADEHDLCRLSWGKAGDCEPVAVRRTPVIRFGGVAVQPPADAFLQPSAEGERAIVETVLAGLADAAPAHIADLYAGCGALTFPLAKLAPVHALEGDARMLDALQTAAKAAPAANAITAQRRDLWRDPPTPDELNAFDTVVFDPPRAGAQPTAQALAQSSVSTVIAVSCNPATLGRDLRILVDGGYTVERVTPIDQFPWSAHVEAVAVLRR
jgi:23S rRNA (uracil1939-C5)-methyltransferase